MEIEFEFKEEKSDITGTILRPIINVFFKTKSGKWLEAQIYLDSGADMTLIPRSLGELLGLEVDRSKIKELKGIGGEPIPVVLANIPTKIGNKEIDVRVAWALIEEVPPLLGRIDIFENFDIEFKQNAKKIIFKY